jgi:chromosome segregation ATPase
MAKAQDDIREENEATDELIGKLDDEVKSLKAEIEQHQAQAAVLVRELRDAHEMVGELTIANHRQTQIIMQLQQKVAEITEEGKGGNETPV